MIEHDLIALSPLSDHLPEPRCIRWAMVLGTYSIYPELSKPPVLIIKLHSWLDAHHQTRHRRHTNMLASTLWWYWCAHYISSSLWILWYLPYVFCWHRTAFAVLKISWACRLSSGHMSHLTHALGPCQWLGRLLSTPLSLWPIDADYRLFINNLTVGTFNMAMWLGES